jgi:SynChlorMet cassette radical SAM/SPASM protein ScmF
MTTLPELTALYYHVTDRCNLRCRHCWVRGEAGTPANHLSLDEAEDIVLQALPLGLRNVKLTGGEPFLVSWILDFVEFCGAHGVAVSFETNGTLITSAVAQRLARFRILCVSVSLDGSQPAIHEEIRMVPGSFEAALAGIRQTVSAGIFTVVLIAVYKQNLADLEQTIRLAESLHVNRVKINPIVPIGRAKDLEQMGELLSIEERIRLFDTVGEIRKGTRIPVEMHFPLLLCPASRMRRDMYCACSIRNMLGVMADGTLCLCGLAHTDRRAIYANIRDTTLHELWCETPPQIIHEIRTGLPQNLSGVCGRCIFRHQCAGACRAKAFMDTGSILGPDPVCQEAFEAGLVPAGRLIYGETPEA